MRERPSRGIGSLNYQPQVESMKPMNLVDCLPYLSLCTPLTSDPGGVQNCNSPGKYKDNRAEEPY